MIASKGSVLHGRNSAFEPTRALYHRLETVKTLPVPLSEEELRALWIVIWAAKCHVHAEAGWAGKMGHLKHSASEVKEALDAVQQIFGEPLKSEDEGVKSTSKSNH